MDGVAAYGILENVILSRMAWRSMLRNIMLQTKAAKTQPETSQSHLQNSATTGWSAENMTKEENMMQTQKTLNRTVAKYRCMKQILKTINKPVVHTFVQRIQSTFMILSYISTYNFLTSFRKICYSLE